mmetsp:Transcript_11301/g.39811  ORF Transcript_11301/g.39811 Transcript_11301/m.39811 type:complete len:285 (-) Transcript_11301:5-859(-)
MKTLQSPHCCVMTYECTAENFADGSCRVNVTTGVSGERPSAFSARAAMSLASKVVEFIKTTEASPHGSFEASPHSKIKSVPRFGSSSCGAVTASQRGRTLSRAKAWRSWRISKPMHRLKSQNSAAANAQRPTPDPTSKKTPPAGARPCWYRILKRFEMSSNPTSLYERLAPPNPRLCRSARLIHRPKSAGHGAYNSSKRRRAVKASTLEFAAATTEFAAATTLEFAAATTTPGRTARRATAAADASGRSMPQRGGPRATARPGSPSKATRRRTGPRRGRELITI